MSILKPDKKSFKFKKIAMIACCLMVFDAFVIGAPALGFVVMFFLIAGSGISATIFFFRDKPYSKLYSIKALIYFAGFMGILGIVMFNAHIGEKNATIVINAIRSYHDNTGRYPEKLNKLIPDYLDRIPTGGYRMSDNRYRYYISQDNAYLMMTVIPPWARRTYDFKNAEWQHLD